MGTTVLLRELVTPVSCCCVCLPCTAAEERKRVEEETEAKREEHKQEQAKLAAQRRAEAEAARKKAEADAAAAAEQAAADAAAAQAGGEAAAQEGEGAAQEVGQSHSAAYGSSADATWLQEIPAAPAACFQTTSSHAIGVLLS